MPPRTVALLGAVCLTIGWLLASMLAPPVAQVQVLPERITARPETDAQSRPPSVEQVHLKLRQTPQPPTPRRNPFEFGTRQRVPDAAQSYVAPPPVQVPLPPPIVGPMLSLSGVGVSETSAGLIYTAVLSDGNTVHLVKAGDAIGGYTAVDVNESSVTLADASGSRYLLRLKN